MPPEASVCACSGPKATRTSPRTTESALLWPIVVIVSATTVRVVSADVQTWSLMLCGPSPENTVTVLSVRENPRVTRKGSHGVAASFSATHVHEHQPHGPSDRRVRAKARAEGAVAEVEPELLDDRARDQHHDGTGMRGRLDAVEPEGGIGCRLERGDQHRHVRRPAP